MTPDHPIFISHPNGRIVRGSRRLVFDLNGDGRVEVDCSLCGRGVHSPLAPTRAYRSAS